MPVAVSSFVVTACAVATGASFTAATVIDTVATFESSRAVVRLEGEAVGAVVVRRRRVGQRRRRPAQRAVRRGAHDRVGQRRAFRVGRGQGDRLGAVFLGRDRLDRSATGASLTAVTVIVTVATFESTLPSFALNVKLSAPL